jgi:dTDP-4-amino-4,6-dideoxygalactose transaminase
MREILAVAAAYDVRVIEDAAPAHGAEYEHVAATVRPFRD